jgi:hypothetical protein
MSNLPISVNLRTLLPPITLSPSCTAERPDMCFDFGDFIIIVEIDEDQHVEVAQIDGDFGCQHKKNGMHD